MLKAHGHDKSTFTMFARTLTSWIMLKTSLIANGMIPGQFWSPCSHHRWIENQKHHDCKGQFYSGKSIIIKQFIKCFGFGVRNIK